MNSVLISHLAGYRKLSYHNNNSSNVALIQGGKGLSELRLPRPEIPVTARVLFQLSLIHHDIAVCPTVTFAV